MIQNYVKSISRNFFKRWQFSLINVLGLALGLGVSLLLLLYVRNELSYDQFHPKSDRKYRIATRLALPNRQMELASGPGPLGPALQEQFPEVIHSCRLRSAGEKIVSYQNKLFRESGIYFSDPGVLDIFAVEIMNGDPKTFLEVPFSLVLTRETAEKYFGSENALGKTVKWNNKHEFTVTGIVNKMPENSHFKFDMLASLSTLTRIGGGPERPDHWMGFNFHTYIELAEGTLINGLDKKFTELLIDNTAEFTAQLGVTAELFLQPLSSIHLHSNLMGELEPGGNIAMIRIYILIAAFILLIAGINFVNLSTARSNERAREVGMRKVLGASREKLIAQFLGEALFYAFLSMLIALLFIHSMLPVYNELIDKQFSIQLFSDWPLGLTLIGLTILVGILAGIYPAFYLSAFRPVQVLKWGKKSRRGSGFFRYSLVTVQYVISIALVICTLVIYTQLHFISHKNLGFNKDQVLVIPLSGEVHQKSSLFKAEVGMIPGIEQVALSSHVPGRGRMETLFEFEGLAGSEPQSFPLLEIDEDYVETMGIEIIKGRNFSREFPGDLEGSMLINETLLEQLGWQDPIGRRVFMTDVEKEKFIQVPYQIIGIVRDFHFESLHRPLEPLLLKMPRDIGCLSIKMTTTNIPELLSSIEAVWKKIEPARPFDYYFLDDTFDKLYRSEQKLGEIFFAFSGIAIFIACLGLFGLVSYNTEQRTKEIGIRKVLGASVTSLFLMISRDFMKWVILANLVAWPLAYWAMKNWLGNFAYHVNPGIWIFLMSGILTLLVAIGTVSWHTIRIAHANPANSLRYE